MGSSCPHCITTEEMLKNEISSGEIKKVNASHAPKNKFRGYPAFENTSNGKTHMGKPSSKQQLYDILGYNDLDPQGPTTMPTNFCISTEFMTDQKETTYFIINMPVTGDPSTKIKSFVIKLKKGSIPTMHPATPKTDDAKCDTQNSAFQTTDPNSSGYIQDFKTLVGKEKDAILKVLLEIFPCTKSDDWFWAEGKTNIDSLDLKKLMPPQPCNMNNGLFYCAGEKTKCDTSCPQCPDDDKTFFDIKTIIMISSIVLLLCIIIMIMYKKK
jgi:hypothetical protein